MKTSRASSASTGEEAIATEGLDEELVDRPGETILWIDSRGRLIQAQESVSRTLGYEPDELLGSDWSSIHKGLRDKDWQRIWDRTRRVGQWRWRATYLRRDGGELPVEVSANFMLLGERECLLAVARDITRRLSAEQERRRLEAQLLHTQKLESLGVLAGGIAHDFNNLLVGILGNTSLALMKLEDDSPGRPHLREVETTARRAAELIGQMLAYSGKAEFVVEVLDLNEVIREMTQLLAVSISKKARLELDLPTAPALVEGDVTQMRQVVMNLITNASEAIGNQSGLITVSTGVVDAGREDLCRAYLGEKLPAGRYTYVEVRDTGCGLDEKARAKIFEPFFTTKASGRGLGMAAVAGILRSHNGAIHLESEPGRGTSFRVLMPASTQQLRRPRLPVEEDSLGAWHGSGCVLVVDDEEVIRLLARKTLEQAGFEVLLARDGVEALEIYHRYGGGVVAVVLDIAMPRLDGIETLYELRCRRPDLRVLLSSGYTEQEVVPAFTSRRFSGYLKKPYKPMDLVRELRRLLEAFSPAGSTA